MPLDEFENYDDYWQKRNELSVLYRYKYVTDHLPETGRVLDIGCGDGTFLKYLKSRKPKLELMGIDLSEVAIAKLKAAGIPGMVYDISETDLLLEVNADYVVIMELLEHLVNPEAVMRKVKMIETQRCYVTIPNLGYIENRLRLGFGGKMPITVIIFHIREHLRLWTVADFKYWADQMGYRVVEYHGQGGMPLLWRFWPSLFAVQMIYVLENKKSSR
jgi:methionine biosynthesis protein MetW